MRKILGTQDNYYNQRKRESIDYLNACNVNSICCALEIYGITKFPKVTDRYIRNPDQLMYFIRNMDIVQNYYRLVYPNAYNTINPNEMMKILTMATNMYLNINTNDDWVNYLAFKSTLPFDAIKKQIIENNNPVIVSVKTINWRGHIIVITGIDEEKQTVILNDPYCRIDSSDTSLSGYNNEITFNEFNSMYKGYGIVFEH